MYGIVKTKFGTINWDDPISIENGMGSRFAYYVFDYCLYVDLEEIEGVQFHRMVWDTKRNITTKI
jgi:hypothetical protein